jgi:hypothetical protein
MSYAIRTDVPATIATGPTTTGSARPDRAGPPARTPVADNRPAYIAWALAWFVGHGAFAVDGGSNPLVDLPSFLPVTLLAAGLVAAMVVTGVVAARNARGAPKQDALPNTLSGAAWGVGFTALFLLNTALGRALGDHQVETLMWPAGSGLVVGLLYLTGGAVQRDVLQYALGAWLALISTAGVFLGTPGLYAVLALAGAGGYAAAAALEPRRRAASPAHR